MWISKQEEICYQNRGEATKNPENYVKVPFKNAISLVGKRQVYIHQGIAYVPLKDLYSIASAHFKAELF